MYIHSSKNESCMICIKSTNMLHPKTLENHIIWLREMVSKIERYTKDIKTYEDFIADERNVDMVIPPIVQIGEIAGKMQKLYPDSLELPYSKII